MIQRNRLVTFLNTYLDLAAFKDESWNGLQIEGRAEVRRVMMAVDAGQATFERAVDERADLLIVHHGLFWKHDNPSLTGWKKRRVDTLLEAGISLYACHLPLDAHAEVGNNAQIIKLLGARPTDTFASYDGRDIGWTGRFARPVTLSRIQDILTKKLGAKCTSLAFGKKTISTAGAVSGGAGYGDFQQAIDAGLDLYVTGEPHEFYHLAKDAGINVIFAGHHATETTGVRALGELIGKRFPVEVKFVDIPTGL